MESGGKKMHSFGKRLYFLGGDVNAVAAVGWSPWPVRLMAFVVLAFNVRLMLNWRREAQAAPGRYFVDRGDK
jgi:hypothetical protein